MFEKEIVLLKATDISNQSEALETLATKLFQKDVVKESYLKAIKDREKEFPTGLLMGGDIGIAIPHTDAEHVLENQIALMTLDSSVDFKQMADDTTNVPVDIIFMLALKDSESQLDTLQKLMSMGQDEEILKQIIASNNEDEVLNILSDNLQK